MVTRGRAIAAASVAIVAVGLSGCGGGDSAELSIELSSIPPTTRVTVEATSPPFTVPPLVTASPADNAASLPPVDVGEWEPVVFNLQGMSSECGNVAFASLADRDLLIAGIALNGLFAMPSAGGEWTALGGAGGDDITNRMMGIVTDPANPATFWESGNYGGGGGVYRTDDNGATFRRVGDVTHVDYLGVDFADPDRGTLLAGAHEQSILYRSTDGGGTWNEMPGLPADVGYAASPFVIDAQTYLLGTFNGTNSGVFKTSDGGATWTKAFDGPVVGAPVARDGRIQWLVASGAGVITSTDDGTTWAMADSRGAIHSNAVQLIGLPDGQLAAVGGDHIVVTTDDGARWTEIGPPLPYTPTGIGYSATRGAFYVSQFACSFEDDNPVAANAIMRFDVE